MPAVVRCSPAGCGPSTDQQGSTTSGVDAAGAGVLRDGTGRNCRTTPLGRPAGLAGQGVRVDPPSRPRGVRHRRAALFVLTQVAGQVEPGMGNRRLVPGLLGVGVQALPAWRGGWKLRLPVAPAGNRRPPRAMATELAPSLVSAEGPARDCDRRAGGGDPPEDAAIGVPACPVADACGAPVLRGGR
jgi:hypothetical protein